MQLDSRKVDESNQREKLEKIVGAGLRPPDHDCAPRTRAGLRPAPTSDIFIFSQLQTLALQAASTPFMNFRQS